MYGLRREIKSCFHSTFVNNAINNSNKSTYGEVI